MKQLIVSLLLLGGIASLPPPAGAVPTTFGPVIGNALLCLDDIDPAYFKRYLTDSLQPPYKTAGKAYWFRADTSLLGVKISQVFVSTEQSRYAFVGAVLDDGLKTARDKLQRYAGIKFQPQGNKTTLRSPAGTYLIPYGNGKSKIFCAKYRLDRF